MSDIYIIGGEVINLSNIINIWYDSTAGGVAIISVTYDPEYYDDRDIFIPCKEEEYIQLVDYLKMRRIPI